MKTILVATIGTNPAVLTETVWALAVNGKKCLDEIVIPDFIVVFAYEKHREDFYSSILKRNTRTGFSGWELLIEDLKNRNIRIKGKLNFGPANIVYYSRNGSFIEDARDQDSCEAIANTFVSKIKSLRNDSDEDVRIIASISGGRKSDSALLLSCMGLLGREGDRIIHLIPHIKGLSKEYLINRANPPFLFPQEGKVYKSDDGKTLFAAEDVELKPFGIPFLMTDRRQKINFISEGITSYSAIVQEQQFSVQKAQSHKQKIVLHIDFNKGNILVNDSPLKKTGPNSSRPCINHSVFLAILCEAFPPKWRSRGEFCHRFFLKAHEAYGNSLVELPSWLTRMVKNTKRGPFHGNTHLADAYNKQLSLARELFKRHSLTQHFVCGTEFKIDWERVIENYEDVKVKFSDLLKRIGLEAPF